MREGLSVCWLEHCGRRIVSGIRGAPPWAQACHKVALTAAVGTTSHRSRLTSSARKCVAVHETGTHPGTPLSCCSAGRSTASPRLVWCGIRYRRLDSVGSLQFTIGDNGVDPELLAHPTYKLPLPMRKDLGLVL